MAGFGHKQSLAVIMSNVRFQIRKRSFARIAAAHNDLLVGDVGFGISKRKKSPLSDFVA